MNIEQLNAKIIFCQTQPRPKGENTKPPTLNTELLQSIREVERISGCRTAEDIAQGLLRTKPFTKTILP